MAAQRERAWWRKPMEPLDQTVAEALSDQADALNLSAGGPARLLVVGGEAAFKSQLTNHLARKRHTFAWAKTLDEARASLARSRFDVLVVKPELPDGDGLELTTLIQKTSPSTKIIVCSESNSTPLAVHAMRCGAVDFITLPVSPDEFLARIDSALIKCRVERQRDERLSRLKKICRELNTARHEISKQVDALCNDLVNAYQEIADQMN